MAYIQRDHTHYDAITLSKTVSRKNRSISIYICRRINGHDPYILFSTVVSVAIIVRRKILIIFYFDNCYLKFKSHQKYKCDY